MHLIHVLTHRIFETNFIQFLTKKRPHKDVEKIQQPQVVPSTKMLRSLNRNLCWVRSFDRLLIPNIYLTVLKGSLRGKPSHPQMVRFPFQEAAGAMDFSMCFHVVFSCMVSAYVRNVGPIFISEVFQTNPRKRLVYSLIMSIRGTKTYVESSQLFGPSMFVSFFPIMQSGLNINGVQNTCTTSSPQHTNVAPLHPANCQFIEQSH